MDAAGLLAAALAVGLFPGGLYLGLASTGARVAAGVRHWRAPSPSEAMALCAATLAAAMLPLPGAPAGVIPDPGGAPSDLLALLLLGGAAAGIGTAPSWDAWRVAAGAAAALPMLALGSSAATLSLTTVAGLPGNHHALARDLAAAALVLAAPAVAGAGVAWPGARDDDQRLDPVGAVLVALLVLTAVAIALPDVMARLPGVAVAAGAAAVVAAVGVPLRLDARRLARTAGAVAVVPALAATVLALAVGNS